MKPSLWAEIHRLREIERWSLRAIARRLRCSRKTVVRALEEPTPPGASPRESRSILDPHCEKIDRLIERYPDLSAVRVLEEIAKGAEGYRGEITLVRRYLQKIRPHRGRIYQEVEYEPAEAMQVDWGLGGSVAVGRSRRRVSVFVAVLCFSRLCFLAFTLRQSKAAFYRSIVEALEFFGGSPRRLIVDNLKAAVLAGSGRSARFHPEFETLCATYRMEPLACERADPESKGVVEGGVRYVKRNALAGREDELQTLEDYHKLAIPWRDEVANVRIHATTRERPIDRFERERSLLRPLPEIPYETDEIVTAIVTPHARVRFDSNRYSVPPELVRKHVVVRSDESHLRILYQGREIARHRRSFEKGQILVLPEHREAALARRRRPRAHEMEARFDALGPEAKAFRLGLLREPVKPAVHLRRILGLVRLYGRAEVLEALSRALDYRTFDAAYVQNLIDQARRRRQIASPLPLSPKRAELLEEVDLEEPDPADYDRLLGLGKE